MPDTPLPFSSVSLANCLQQAGPQDLVLTASNRLAREIRQRLASNGHRLLPRVWPLDRWLMDSWQRLRFQQAISGQNADEGLLLTEAHEEILWDRALRAAGAEDRLLFLDETVRACLRAANMLEQYRLPREHPAWQRSEECRLFLEWQQAVDAECAQHGWLPSARLEGWLTQKIPTWSELRGLSVFVAGFDETTPAQDALFAAIGQVAHGYVVEEPVSSASTQRRLYAAADAAEEWRAAATWAKRRLQDFPDGRFAVVVPDLTAQHAHVARVFQAVFHPESIERAAPWGRSAFHMSFAPPLAESPLAQTGLHLLRVLKPSPALGDLRYLLRSHFVDGAVEESEARALLEVRLLGERLDRVPLHRLRSVAIRLRGDLPELGLDRVLKLVARLEEATASAQATPERAPSAWMLFVRALWTQSLWLDASLTSAEFQLRQRLLEELGSMSLLDAVLPACSLARFVRLLRGRLERTGFQAESPGGQVLVAGMFEVTGLRFDGVWICGLTDSTLPRAIAPDPFLPIELQRAGKVPRADVAREREFAGKLFARLCRLAPELVLSYAKCESDQALQPSPLLRTLRDIEPYPEAPIVPPTPTRQPADSEFLEDWDGGAFLQDSGQLRGGVSVLKNQSDCPFRAFAAARLGSDAVEWHAPLMDRLDQGSLIHDSLEEFWNRTNSREALQALDEEQRAQRIAACVEKALQRFHAEPDDALALAQKDAERERLQWMLASWMEEEGARQPFVTEALEAKRTIPIGQTQLRLRADRLDRLPDGSFALIDYKTGKTDPKKWLGDRPEEPQLLAYLSSETRNVSTLAFASLKAGEMGWKAFGKSVDTNFKPLENRQRGEPPEGWEAFAQNARQVVGRLIAEFEGGFAAVDPRNPKVTCAYCVQQPFCRISEVAATDDEENGGEDA